MPIELGIALFITGGIPEIKNFIGGILVIKVFCVVV
jgi:hypothetical protein